MLHIASPLMAQEIPGFFCAKLRRLAEIVGRRQRMPGLVAGTCEVPGLFFGTGRWGRKMRKASRAIFAMTCWKYLGKQTTPLLLEYLELWSFPGFCMALNRAVALPRSLVRRGTALEQLGRRDEAFVVRMAWEVWDDVGNMKTHISHI